MSVLLLVVVIPVTYPTVIAMLGGFAFSSTIQVCLTGDHPDGCRDDPSMECEIPRPGNETKIMIVGSIALFYFNVLGYIKFRLYHPDLL